ncbi:O-antigen ligase family protein [Bacterioplanoides sp.]|uniref:O-antigen ligase family protein n=1 Tax=Bacterioplanoides sp. TaxID=2066072 RepID=UPI003B5C45FC
MNDAHAVSNKVLYGYVVVFILFIFSYLEQFISGARYIKYLVPVFVLFFYVLDVVRTRELYFVRSRPAYPFVFLVFYGLFLSIFYGESDLRDLYFLLTAFAPLLFLGTVPLLYIDIAAKVLAVLYLIEFSMFGSVGEISFIDSKSSYEGTISFLFGFFVLWYSVRRKWIFSLLFFVLLLLSLKRIALIGVVLGGGYLLMFRAGRDLRYIEKVIYIIPIFALVFSLAFSLGLISYVLEDYFGVSIGYLTMGRSFISAYVYEAIAGNGMVWFGYGPGVVYEYVSEATDAITINLHNDYLKIFLEYGVFGFLVFFALFARAVQGVGVVFYIYLSCLFLTDNCLIYPQVLFFILAAIDAEGNDCE